MQQRYSNYLT
jgi:hypothetical protein